MTTGPAPLRTCSTVTSPPPVPTSGWVADITYVATWAGFLFPAVVLDVFTRQVVGWSMAANQNTELVTRALQMAMRRRRPTGVVVHHSDQGCQYTSYDFAKACKAARVTRSMGSVGDCFDNALAESFFATLECELLDRSVFENRTTARMAIFDYIEGFYNQTRRHSSVGNLSPLEFERRWRANLVSSNAA